MARVTHQVSKLVDEIVDQVLLPDNEPSHLPAEWHLIVDNYIDGLNLITCRVHTSYLQVW